MKWLDKLLGDSGSSTHYRYDQGDEYPRHDTIPRQSSGGWHGPNIFDVSWHLVFCSASPAGLDQEYTISEHIFVTVFVVRSMSRIVAEIGKGGGCLCCEKVGCERLEKKRQGQRVFQIAEQIQFFVFVYRR